MSNPVELTEDQLNARMPKPVGYRVLIALPTVEETFGESGIIKSSKMVNEEKVSTVVGLVVDMGDQAYADKERYPSGAWCKEGDWVVFRAYSGTRLKVDGVEYRILNDDSIEGVVTDPSGLSLV